MVDFSTTRQRLGVGESSGFSPANLFTRTKILSFLGAVIVLILALNVFHTVPTGYRGVVTQFGKIVGVESEGLVVLFPWQTLTNFNVRSETTDVPKAQGSTSDQQPVDVALTVRYSIQTDKVAEVFEKYSRNGDLSSYVDTATQEVFKAVTAKYNAPELISKRPQVSSDIYGALNAKLAVYGAHVINIDIRNFEFGKTYMDAINAKVTQEQLRQVEENKLRTVEATQKQKVAIAEAEANAAKAKADGDAYALEKVATAQANALKIQNAALAQNKDVLELRRIEVDKVKAERWDGKLPQQLFGSAPMPFMSIDKK